VVACYSFFTGFLADLEGEGKRKNPVSFGCGLAADGNNILLAD